MRSPVQHAHTRDKRLCWPTSPFQSALVLSYRAKRVVLDHHGQPWRKIGPFNIKNHILIVAVDLFLTMKLLAEAVLKVPALIRLRHAKQRLKNVRARQENKNTTNTTKVTSCPVPTAHMKLWDEPAEPPGAGEDAIVSCAALAAYLAPLKTALISWFCGKTSFSSCSWQQC